MFAKCFFISLLLACLAFEASKAEDGQTKVARPRSPTDVTHRISKREAVKRGEDPSMGLVSSSKVYWWQCGATVLSPKLAFTTADCCVSWNAPTDLALTVGSTELTARDNSEKGPVQTRTSKFYVHQEQSGKYKNNFCMLELDTPLTIFEKDVSPANLYMEIPKVGMVLTVFRWTTTNTRPPYKMTLDSSPCSVMSNEECGKSYPEVDSSSTVCCRTQGPTPPGKIEANQLMFQNASGALLLVGHQLTYGSDLNIGLFSLASRVVDWVKDPRPPNVPVKRGEDPAMGLVSSSKVYWWQCGATVLSPKSAFTTADCCVSWNAPMDLALTVGSTELTARDTSEKGPVQTRTSKFYVHPGQSGKYKNNFCILDLDTPLIIFEKDVAPANLYMETPKVGMVLTVYRWSTVNTRPPYNMTLVSSPCIVMSSEECGKSYPGTDPTTTICCSTRGPAPTGKISADQLMFQMPNGTLLFVGHQLAHGSDLNIGLFSLASRVADWIKNPIPASTPSPPTSTTTTAITTTTTTPAPTVTTPALTAARGEADPQSLTSTTLNQFSGRLGQDLATWYAARYFNWTQLLLFDTPPELPAQLESLRREISDWEKIANLSGNGLLPRPSLVATEVTKKVNEIPGLDPDQGGNGVITSNRTKTSTLVELETIKALDQPGLDSVYGRVGLQGVNTTHWLAAPLYRNLIDPLRTGLNWLEFLQLTLQTFSAGPIQSDGRTKTDLAIKIGRCDLPDSTLLNCLTNIIQTFPKLSNNSKTPEDVLRTFKALSPTAQILALKDLNGVIEVTLKGDPVSCTYDAGSLTLVARGRFVSLKTVVSGTPNCVKAYLGRVKNLVIFASSTFFVDSDLKGVDIAGREGEPLSLTIFSPWWEFSTTQSTLDLSGGGGKDAPSTKPGPDLFGVGGNGAPGGPGQNAGNILIMGQGKIPKSGSGALPGIRLELIGGPGGRGQDGGDGVKGPDGKGADFSTEYIIYISNSQFNAEEYVKRYGVPCQVSRLPGHTNDCPWMGNGTPLCYQFRCPGVGDGTGKNGGSGGKGGLGGNSGTFTDYIGAPVGFFSVKAGASGAVGKGGRAGPRGKKGPTRIIHYLYEHDEAFFKRTKDYYEPVNEGNPEPGPSSCNGCSPLNPVALSPSIVKNRYWSSYLSFVLDQKQLLDPYTQASIFRFLIKVEGLNTFQLSRESLEPFQDLQAIEIGAARLEEKGVSTGGPIHALPDLSPLLNAFLAKVYYLATTVATPGIQHPRRNIPAPEYRKALFALYTAAYSRLESFSDFNPEPLLVVNVAGYLTNAAAAFRDLHASQQNLQRLAIVGRANDVYQQDINAKFKEADLFIQLVLNPGLEKIMQQIDKSTDDLVTEIVKLQNSANADLQALQTLQQKLQARGPLQIFLGIFNMVGSALAVLGKKGEIAGVVMNLAGGAIEAATMAGNPEDVPLTPIPPSITAADAALAQKLKEKNEVAMKNYWAQLDYISELLRQDGSPDAQPIQKEVTAVKAKLTEFQSTISSDVSTNSLLALEAYTNFTTLHREIQANLSAAFDAALHLHPAPQKPGRLLRKKRWEKPDAVERAERVVHVGLDTFSKYRGDQSRLDVVAKQIEATKTAIANMDLQMENVEKVMKPVLIQMRADLDRARKTMGKQSAVALTVNQWHVQQMLKALKTELRKMFTTGFSGLDESLSTAFENLQETMTTLTNVYDKLETLQGQSKLANLISKSQSAVFTSVIVNNPDLNRALNNLNGVIQSTVVSEQYEFALKSFNTWIFPFARFFSGEFTLPIGMQSLMLNASQVTATATIQINASMNAETFVQRLLDTVGGRLEKLRLKMGEYMTTVMIFDGALIPKAQFYRPRPFYLWPANRFQGQIASLLRGERVILIADVRASNGIFHAVKFRKIRLEFGVPGNLTSATPTIVNDYLSHFTVRMVHTGNSGFRYGSSYFNVMTPSLRLEYGYSAPGTPYPVDANGIYDKVMSGDLSLSPYTMWDVQLFPHISGVEKIPGFGEVMKMAVAGGLDLYLVGEGSRVTTDLFSEDQLQLEVFYNKESNGTSI